MNEEITVKVHSYGPDRPLALVYIDPVSRKKKARSAGTYDQKKAERMAGELEKELRAGRSVAPSRATWSEFRERYRAIKLATMADAGESAEVSLDRLERDLDPDRPSRLTAAVMADFQAKLRKGGMKETTIARHLRHIKAALRWAAAQGMIPAAPKIELPKRQRGQKLMKSRPITAEEFERMLGAVPKVRRHDAPDWDRYLTGLWLSGLRLEESVILSWDEEAPFSVDLSGKHPRFRILGQAQKSGRDELVPMTPDFAEFLLATPDQERHGPVFPLVTHRGKVPFADRQAGRIVSQIGEKAGVVVNKTEGKKTEGREAKCKFATAHDLRRAFGTRWARRVMPAVLQRLMRHAGIQTTMAYYVDLDADELAAELWSKHPSPEAGNTFGNIGPRESNERRKAIATTPIQD